MNQPVFFKTISGALPDRLVYADILPILDKDKVSETPVPPAPPVPPPIPKIYVIPPKKDCDCPPPPPPTPPPSTSTSGSETDYLKLLLDTVKKLQDQKQENEERIKKLEEISKKNSADNKTLRKELAEER